MRGGNMKYKVTITAEVGTHYLGNLREWKKDYGFKSMKEVLEALDKWGEYKIGEYDNIKIAKVEKK